MKLSRILARIGLVGLGLAASSSFAALLDGSGQIGDGWNFTPFNNSNTFGNWGNGSNGPLQSGVNGRDTGATSNMAYTEQNNSSPIDFSPFESGPPYVPSPASVNQGEQFDQEFLGWRLNGNGTTTILGITSMNPTTGVVRNGRTFHLGDVFLDVNHDGKYDFALTAGQWNTSLNDPLHSENGYSHMMDIGLYQISTSADVHNITNTGGFGSFPSVSGPSNPFSVRDGATELTNSVGYIDEKFNYGEPAYGGANEGDGTAAHPPTWVLEWTFDTSLLGAGFDPTTTFLHWTTECGNDIISTGPINPTVPEPASLALIGLGLTTVGALRRRKLTA